MAKDDFHDKAFDEGTILKLEILSRYLESWLPVFINHPTIRHINIFDFQCGPGQDKNKIKGSPLRIIDVVAAAKPAASAVEKIISIHFNDIDGKKIKQLSEKLNIEVQAWNISYSSVDFEKCIDEHFNDMNKQGVANFLFIDPTGLVNMALTIEKISQLAYTDFLLFVPVQHVSRLYMTDGFQNHLPGLKCTGTVEKTPKELCAYIDEKLREQRASYFLAHFSIKKSESPNVHGLIFGSKHPIGLDKFLRVAWDISPNGVSNFEMSGDLLFAAKTSGQCTLPGIKEYSTRQELFRDELKGKVVSGDLTCARDVALFCYRNAFLPTKHATPVLKELVRNGKLSGVPPLSPKIIFTKNRNEPLILL